MSKERTTMQFGVWGLDISNILQKVRSLFQYSRYIVGAISEWGHEKRAIILTIEAERGKHPRHL